MDTDNIDTDNKDTVKVSTLVIAIFITIVLTVLSLEMNGFIKHSNAKDTQPIAEYRAIVIERQKDKLYRLSHKPSNQTAICNAGYLFITSDLDDDLQALLVDYKNRGVTCIPGP